MLKSYEAIYDKGHLHWIGTPPRLEHARVMVVVSEPESTAAITDTFPEHNGARLAAILRETSPELSTRLQNTFGDPLTWQLEQRQDRSLPGRESDG